MEEKITYKITDNLFIYRDEKGREDLLYVINSPKKVIKLLNMREVEANVSKAVQKYIRFLNIDNEENLNEIKLFAFLLKVKLYIEYISRNLLGHMLFDEYEQFEKDSTLAYIIAEYLLNREHLSEENRSIVKDAKLFDKLYSLIKDITFKMTEFDIKYIYTNFYLALKSYQNNNTQVNNPTSIS